MKMLKIGVAVVVVALITACGTAEEGDEGKSLFSSKGCTNCHGEGAVGVANLGPPINDGTKNADNVRGAIANVGAMSDYQGALTDEEIDDIGEYLDGLGASSKLTKVAGRLTVNTYPGVVVVKDSTGKTRTVESDTDNFDVDVAGLSLPFMLVHIDEDEQALFAMTDGSTTEVDISPATDEALYEKADVGELFDACEEGSVDCFSELVSE